jgi:hypothetical protein
MAVVSMVRTLRYLCAALLMLAAFQARAATTILPNGLSCFSATTGLNGMVGLLGTIVGGSGYTNGTYGGVALTGGSGTGATATITVSGGAVTSVAVLAPGKNYIVADSLSATGASIGGTGSGFSVPVSSIAINGSLAGGSVNMFVPNTTTPKNTWADPNQVTLNANPILLDGNGCHLIYGTGSYRQQVLDSLGNLVWDALTADTSAPGSVFNAGTAGGTANAITVTDVGFAGTDGAIITFYPTLNNTGATTLNPSAFGAIAINKDTTTGPVALSGGEIVATNAVTVQYDAVRNIFHLLNLVQAAATQNPPTLCGAVGLKITNDASFPNSKVNVTADQVVMTSATGAVISRASINVPVNFSLNGAGALDTGSFASSTWYNVWVIDNGIAASALGSLSATAPTMPSAYSYKCRLGAVRTDGSTNLLRTFQTGAITQYQLVASSNTTIPPVIANGTAGTISTTSPTLVTASITSFVPPTATDISINVASNYQNGTAANVYLAPSTTWGGTNNGPAGSNGVTWPYTGTTNNFNTNVWLKLEATTVAWASSAAGGAIAAMAWRDKVNAN